MPLTGIAAFFDQPADLSDWLNGSNLIIRQHNRDQNSLIRDRFSYVVQANNAFTIDRQISDLPPFFLQVMATRKHSRMLDLRSDNFPPSLRLRCGDPLDRQVIRFSAAREVGDLCRLSIDQERNLPPRFFDRLLCALAPLVRARCIAIDFNEIRNHCRYYFVVDTRRCAVIQIDSFLIHSSLIISPFRSLDASENEAPSSKDNST